MSAARENWRIVLLVVLILGSMVTLFVPGATAGGGADVNETGAENVTANESQMTNLQYGIQLDGGSRIRAPIVGNTTEDVNVTVQNEGEIESALVSELDLDRIDVEARPQTDTVEVFSRNVTRAEFQAALQDQGIAVSDSQVRAGVTQPTRDEMVEVINRKLSASALSGISVQEASTPTGQNYIVVEAPGRDISDLRDILSERGTVTVYAYYRTDNGTIVQDPVLNQSQFDTIGNVRQLDRGDYGVSVTLTDEAAGPFMQAMQEHNLDQATICRVEEARAEETLGQGERCLLTTLNEDPIFAALITDGLGSQFADGSFVNDPSMTMSAPTREEARNLELSLKAGQPLPAPLELNPERGAQTTSLEPELGEQFRGNSLIIGLLAVLAVSGAVYVRYRDARVAVPMVVTALSEVLLLLGFVSVIQYPIDLSHLAGFIAVIGTGVDDLVIIADEILQQEGVATGRVFQNRFRKAFWVIGAAAATTIIAMSPLTVLSLGDLSGFAIITIVGVLIGVLVTRPAYGDILRHLILAGEEREE